MTDDALLAKMKVMKSLNPRRRGFAFSRDRVSGLLLLVGCFLVARPAIAQKGDPAAAVAPPPPSPARFGVEADVVTPWLPGVNIVAVKGSATLWTAGSLRGDLTLGVSLRPPQFQDDQGTLEEYGGIVGYRQYVWKGLHAEVSANLLYSHLKNDILDGKTYAAFTLLPYFLAGYRFDVLHVGERSSLYVLPQAGVGVLAWVSNPWPRNGSEGAIPVGSLLVGATF